MVTFLIVVGCIWFGVATIFVISLACAARRRMPPIALPPPQMTAVSPATSSSNSFAEKQTLPEENPFEPIAEENSEVSARPETALVSSPSPSGMRE